MKLNMLYGIILCSILASLLLYAIRRDMLIFMYPAATILQTQQHISTKKTITLFYWKHNKWNRENTDIVWNHHQSECIKTISNALLTLLHEEAITTKKSSVQSVSVNEAETYAYVSFDRSFLNKEYATSTKLMIVESILKTLRENGITVQHIQFLIHHEPIHDHHLDMTQPWPITGFVEAAGNGIQ